MRSFDDIIRLAVEQISPGRTAFFDTPAREYLLSSRTGLTFESFTDESGTPFFVVGSFSIGDNFVIG